MRLVDTRSKKCERARHWISLRADGELSEFEGVLLAAHLCRCAECRAFRLDVDAMVSALRGAPLERLSRPIELPRRRRVRAASRLQHVGYAAALIVVFIASLGGLSALGRGTGGHSPPARTVTVPNGSTLRPPGNFRLPDRSHRFQAE
jgi:predicted anti-sigma-YlaC factor YlaD